MKPTTGHSRLARRVRLVVGLLPALILLGTLPPLPPRPAGAADPLAGGIRPLHGTNEIELFIFHTNRDHVLLHFATQANRSYTIQYSPLPLTRVAGGRVPATNWANLFTLPALPQDSHINYRDHSITNEAAHAGRLYRLLVMP